MSENAEHVVREALAAATFVEIIDTLVTDFDVIDVLTLLSSRCVELLGAAAAGILLADSSGLLRVIGASSEEIGILELFQIQNDDGPCLECFKTGAVVLDGDMRSQSPWPGFATESVRAGFPSVCAVPLRLNGVILGCLNLFLAEPVPLSQQDIALARALADVASIAIAQDRVSRESAIREGQLQRALDSRIAIEQAKGMIAERNSVGMDEAFAHLRTFARNNNRGLTEVAEQLAAGSLPLDSLTGPEISPAAGHGH